MQVAEKIVRAIGAIQFSWDGKSYEIGASAGVTPIADDAHGPVELMSEADAACYVAKARGRGQVALYVPSDSD